MSKIDGNDLAFPISIEAPGTAESHSGMTIRTWLAGQALAGLIGEDKYMERICTATNGKGETIRLSETNADCIAKQAITLADATIKALNEETGQL